MLLIFSYIGILTFAKHPRTKPSHFVPFALTKYNQSVYQINETETGIGRYIYSNTAFHAIVIIFPGTRFWVEGYTRSNQLQVELTLNHIYPVSVNLSGEWKDSVVYYNSNQLDFQKNTVALYRGNNDLLPGSTIDITFSRLLYNYLSPLDSINNGLIRVYTNEIAYDSEHWTIDGTTMSTNVTNASASCFFYGIKAFIYASKLSNGGEMGVYIDDELQDTIYLQSSTVSTPSVVYSSHDLPFGKHKIEVRHSDSPDKSINLTCFLYRPHLIFNSCVYRPTWPSEWKPTEASGTQPAYHQSTNGAATHLIRCTRFWLVGLKGEDYGSFNIRISNEIETKVNTNVSTHYNLPRFYSVLLYQSPVLEFNTYNITITPLGDKPVAISDIFFSQQPKDAVIVYGKDLKASGKSDFDPTRETFGLTAKDSTFQFTYFGTKFFIFGESDAGGSAYAISEPQGQVCTGTSSNSEKIRLNLFAHKELQFGTHVITLTQTQDQPKYLFISYIFYLTFSNPPVEPYEILTTDIINSTYDADNTTYDADNTTYKYIELPRIGSNATFIYGGYNFTIQGYVGPANGNVNIYDNGNLLHSNVPLYREEYGLSFFYASPNLKPDIHQISVVNCNGNLVGVSKIYYKPTPSQAFTQSISFSNSALFSKSLQFSDSEYFTKSISFSNSESFEPSTAFTYSDSFTKSSLFSESEGFSKSIEFISSNFTSSFLFTYSNSFTSSFSFTYSNSFSASSDFPLESDNNNKPSKSVNIIIGVVVSLIVVLLIVLIIIFVYLRRRKKHSSLDNDTNTMHEADASTMNIAEITQNEDLDSVVNSFSNDIFGERNLNYEEDQNDYPDKNF